METIDQAAFDLFSFGLLEDLGPSESPREFRINVAGAEYLSSLVTGYNLLKSRDN